MATLNYDVTKPLSLIVAQSVSQIQEALAECKRVAGLALATASGNGDAGQDATWSVVEGSGTEYGVVAGNSSGVNGHAWFTAVDTLGALLASGAVIDALQKLDKGA